MAKFCPECAHPIIDSNMQFCSKCGAKLPITSPKVQPAVNQPSAFQQPAHPSSNIPPVNLASTSVQTPALQSQDRTIESTPKKKRSTGEWIAICCGCVILIVILMAVFSYMITGSSGNFSSSNDVIITQDLNSMALTINDLPIGWQTYGTTVNMKDEYHSKFMKTDILSADFVYQDISRNATVKDAKNAYLLKKGKITQFKVEPVNLGNEGFGYINTDSSIVVFREGNVIVSTQYGLGGFGVDSSSLSISDAGDYAKIIANRIQ